MPPRKDPIGIAVNVEERDGQTLVGITFNRKISWFGLTADESVKFANFILEKVREIREVST